LHRKGAKAAKKSICRLSLAICHCSFADPIHGKGTWLEMTDGKCQLANDRWIMVCPLQFALALGE